MIRNISGEATGFLSRFVLVSVQIHSAIAKPQILVMKFSKSSLINLVPFIYFKQLFPLI